ncbi:hypothetical protein C8R45DRAFT_991543 [Mycena sanguinolenta]|nr:hypothetical protein C8R45DRAFT_991543 [Mycena sanguinolenta]
MTRWNIAPSTSDDSETNPTCIDSSFQTNEVNEAHPNDLGRSLIQAISVSEGLYSNVATWTEALLARVDPEDEKLATRYRTPAITLGDKCLHHFITFVVGGTTSAIRQYSTQNKTLYFASVGNGANLRWGCVVMPGPASLEAIAKEFHAKEFHSQAMGSVLSRTVYNHRRFVLDKPHAGESIWQSRFSTVRKSYDGVEFDWITTPDENLWLPRQRQIIMTLDHNYMNPVARFDRVLDVLGPFFVVATQKMFAGYLMAVLAAISKLPTMMEKRLYLKHQRNYLENRIKVERDYEFSAYTQQQRMALYHQGIQQIAHLFETISKSVDICSGYPTQEQVTAAEIFGLTLGQWDVGSSRYMAAFHNAELNLMSTTLRYNEEIGPYRRALKATVYPTLEWRSMEPEYTLHGHQIRLKFEQFRSGELLTLPDLTSALEALPASRILHP